MAVGEGYENGAEVKEMVNSLVQSPCKMDRSVLLQTGHSARVFGGLISEMAISD